MSQLQGHGVEVDLPTGWEGRIEGRRPDGPGNAVAAGTGSGTDGASTVLVQLANFPLPPERGDFGGGVVDSMKSGDVFVVLFEYGRESAGTPLFEARGVPRLRYSDFHPNALRKMIDGQSGVQRFFQVDGRAFCIYVVLGAHLRRVGLTPIVNDLLSSIRLDR